MDYFESKLEKINTDRRSISPGPIFTLLRSGIKSYYDTFQVFNDKSKLCYFAYGELNVEIRHDFVTKYFNSIICIQLFFEQYIGTILSNVRRLFVYGKLRNEIDLINILTDNLDEIPLNEKKIDYKNQLERFCKLVEYHDALPEYFRIDPKYHFLKENVETLRILANQRNNIIHSGEEILPIYLYELLMVNYILPLIKEVLKVENERIIRKNYSEIEVLDELTKINLPDKADKLTKKLELQLHRICHLKELGRASHENPLYMHEFGFNEVAEEKYNKPKRELAFQEAELKRNILKDKEFSEIYVCPCCGTQSLYTFEIWYYFADAKSIIEKAKCLLCTYSVNRDIGEPKKFGLKVEELFKEIKNGSEQSASGK